MTLQVDEGLDIPVERSRNRELLSGFLSDSTTVLPLALAVGPGDNYTRLGVNTVSQKPQDMWCWAACVEMVLRFYGAPKDMCEIAGLKLEKKCCGASSKECDTGLSVEDIGRAFGAAGLIGNIYKKLKFEGIKSRINGKPAQNIPGGPVVAGIEWQGGGGHLVVISGWRTADSLRYVKVNDPYYTTGDIRYEDLEERYGPNDNGRWVYTWADFRRV
jgi:hypothetical protein